MVRFATVPPRQMPRFSPTFPTFSYFCFFYENVGSIPSFKQIYPTKKQTWNGEAQQSAREKNKGQDDRIFSFISVELCGYVVLYHLWPTVAIDNRSTSDYFRAQYGEKSQHAK